MKIRLPKPKMRAEIGSHVLIVAAMGALVGFGATFGLRWALLATAVDLILLGMAVGN